jgi:hypothetical protein
LNKIGSLLALLVLLGACGDNSYTAPPVQSFADPAQAALPARLDIPAIAIHVEKLDTYGFDSKGNYSCPINPQTAAWNRTGTVPGESGLASMIGGAQGVFQRLGDLKPNDLIYVNRTDGTRLTFKKLDPTGTATSRAQLELSGCGAGTPVTAYAQLVP